MSIEKHISRLKNCTRCPEMIGPVITGEPLYSPVMSVGQAPGIHEGKLQRPFAWTAGKTLFKWFQTINVNEAEYRRRIYMVAVCRCFPGRNPKGGDRVPSRIEIQQCSQWLEEEYRLQQPELIIPIGKLAMQQYLKFNLLTEVVGKTHKVEVAGRQIDIIPLPHPSGVSTWFRKEPGKSLLRDALQLIDEHPAWRKIFQDN